MLRSRTCLRAALPYTPNHNPRSGIALQVQTTWHVRRVFATTPRHRKDASRTVQKEKKAKQPIPESVKPESVTPAKAAQPSSKNGPLLAEQTVSNKEQRKMDWAIMKDMVQYLWPKNDFNTRFRVSLSLGLLIGAKVGSHRTHVSPVSAVDRFYVGVECAGSILLQGYRGFHEH